MEIAIKIILFLIVIILIILLLLIRKKIKNSNQTEERDIFIKPQLEKHTVNPSIELEHKLNECINRLQSERQNKDKLLSELKDLEKNNKLYKKSLQDILITHKIILSKEERNSIFINSFLEQKNKINVSFSLFVISLNINPNINNINLLDLIDKIIIVENSNNYNASELVHQIYNIGKLIVNYCKKVLEIDNESEIANILLSTSNIIKNKCYDINFYVPQPSVARFDINSMESNQIKQGELIKKIITWGVTVKNIEYKPMVE